MQLSSWHWIFWINVPIGLVLVPLAARRLAESYGPSRDLDMPGLGLASTGLFGIVYGLVQSQSLGWTSPEVVIGLALGAALVLGFIVRELRAVHPMLPMRFFADRAFAVTNVVSLAMYFGMFGSIFFLSQFLQNVLHNTPFQAGLKLLVWTGATMIVSPLAGFFSERYGSRLFMVSGLALQAIALAWLATLASVDQSYASMVGPFVLAGSGMALVFAPAANAVAVVGSHRSGRPGIRRYERDPGAGRRPRDRRVGDRLHEPRQLQLAAGLCQRAGSRDVGCSRCPRRRFAGRGAAPVQHASLRGRPRGRRGGGQASSERSAARRARRLSLS